jgi:hypothetical protein
MSSREGNHLRGGQWDAFLSNYIQSNITLPEFPCCITSNPFSNSV